MNKKQLRIYFRESVFSRDKHKCRVCGFDKDLDAHHITNRNEIPSGGYVSSNGISLCKECHFKAEKVYQEYFKTNIEVPTELIKFTEKQLYKLISSSKEKAFSDSLKLKID
jgi:5-methylcytosine-specific restriction endonuclease McrA